MKEKEEKKEVISTRTSHVVPHRSTNLARGSLTSEIRRDPVLSAWYGRLQSKFVPQISYKQILSNCLKLKKQKK